MTVLNYAIVTTEKVHSNSLIQALEERALQACPDLILVQPCSAYLVWLGQALCSFLLQKDLLG